MPHWPTDRWRRHGRADSGPLVLTASGQGGVRLTAVDAMAAAEGLAPGMMLADARALVPHLVAAEADPDADAAALVQLAEWCSRFTPVTAVDGPDGVLLDLTGCTHLWGGELALLQDLADRLARVRVTARLGLADTPATAWAWARFGRQDGTLRSTIIAPGRAKDHLGPLPVPALRLPDGLAADLARVGLRHVGDLLPLPRAPLVARYGEAPGRRLDQALGIAPEPITPLRPPVPWRSEAAFIEPISRREDLEEATRRLLLDLCRLLDGAGQGARRLELAFHRVDGTVAHLAIGASQPSHDPGHLLRLFREGFGTVDPGFGVERMVLVAPAVDRIDATQAAFDDTESGTTDFAQLVDRLHTRVGERRVVQPVERGSHLPERGTALVPLELSPKPGAWTTVVPRPVMLLPRPEPVEVMAPVPDSPPNLFVWRRQRHRVARADGPERIEPEWWDGTEDRWRDYYRVEDEQGRRFWLYRSGAYAPDRPASWFLHGLFA